VLRENAERFSTARFRERVVEVLSAVAEGRTVEQLEPALRPAAARQRSASG
jgi:hypothetical protein